MTETPRRTPALLALLLFGLGAATTAPAAGGEEQPGAPSAELAAAQAEAERGREAARRGELEAAASHHRGSLAIRERLAPESLDLAASLADLGDVERQRGDLDGALELHRRALALRERLAPESLDHAASLRELGIVLRLKGVLDEAESLLHTALAIQDREAPEGAEGARTRAALGTLALVRGDLAAGEALHREALAVLDRVLPDGLEVASSWNNLGTAARDGGRLDEAEANYRRALELYQRISPESLNVAILLNNLGLLASTAGDLDRSEQLHHQALAIRERLSPGRLDHAASLRNLGIVAYLRGDLEGAAEGFAGSLAIEERLAPGSPTVAGSLNNLGLVASTRGDLERATDYYSIALAIYERLAPEGLEHSYVLTNLGLVAQARGDLERAADLQLRALELSERHAPDSRDVHTDLVNLGNTAHAAGDLESAAAYYGRALTLARKLSPDGLQVAYGEDNLGLLAHARGDLASARQHHERALALKRANTAGGLVVAASLVSLGEVALEQGDLEAAAGYLAEALRIEERLAPGSARLAQTLYHLATVERRRGRLEEAARGYSEAATALELQVGRLGGAEEQRAGFRSRHAAIYRDWIELLVDLGRGPEAFAVLERSRARSFLSLLADRDLVFRADVSPELERERRELAVRYDRALGELETLDPERDRERVEARLAELRDLRDRLAQVRAEIRAASPRLAELQDPRPVDLATVRHELEPGTLLLAFSVGGDQTDLFAIGAGGELSVHRLPIGAEDLRREIETLRELIQATATPSPRVEGLRAASRRLFERLLAPVEARIESSDRLLLVPDGPLLRLPWAALVRPARQGRAEIYLAAWKPLATTLSATVHLELGRRARREPAGAPGRFSGFGDPVYAAASQLAPRTSEQLAERGCRLAPLPATRREVEEIGRLYGDRARLYLGAEATEERAKEALRRAHAVHFAVHGCLDERFPLNSGLALSLPAGDGGAAPAAGTETPPSAASAVGRENGLLQAWEIFEEVRTEADMVILSACDSGLGRETTGEGLLGLTRALQFAGTRTVLSSLWQVADEATAELMIRFYRELADGIEPDAALRAAQLHLVSGSAPAPRAGDWELPYYWAAFQLSR